MALTRTEVEGYARKAGFTGNDLNIAVAVAKAESGWNPNAHNSQPPDDSYGLWQINMYQNLGPTRRKQFGISSNAALFDPATNAKAAHMVYQSSGWKAWTTYTSGKYKQFLSDSTVGDTATPVPRGSDPILGVGSALNALGDTLYKVGANIGGILVAVVLLVLGVVLIARNHIPTGVAGTVKGVLKK